MGKRIVITDLPFELNGHWGSCSEHLVIHGNGSITDTEGHDIGKCVEEIQSAQSGSEMSTLISRIRKCINSGNRGNCDYYIVDQIENIINEYNGV